MLHRGRRQCRLQADADHPSVPAGQGCRAHGQKHHDAQGHPWPPGEQPVSGEVRVSLGTRMIHGRKIRPFKVIRPHL